MKSIYKNEQTKTIFQSFIMIIYGVSTVCVIDTHTGHTIACINDTKKIAVWGIYLNT